MSWTRTVSLIEPANRGRRTVKYKSSPAAWRFWELYRDGLLTISDSAWQEVSLRQLLSRGQYYVYFLPLHESNCLAPLTHKASKWLTIPAARIDCSELDARIKVLRWASFELKEKLSTSDSKLFG
jgi:hypothetical protein